MQRGFCHDSIKFDIDATAAAAHRVRIFFIIHIVGLCHDIDRFKRSDRFFKSALLQVFDILFGDRFRNVEVTVDFGRHRVKRTSVETHINVGDITIHFIFQFLHNAHDSVFGVFHILHATVAHAVGKFFFFEMVHTQIPCCAFFSNSPHNFCAAYFNCHDMLEIFHK